MKKLSWTYLMFLVAVGLGSSFFSFGAMAAEPEFLPKSQQVRASVALPPLVSQKVSPSPVVMVPKAASSSKLAAPCLVGKSTRKSRPCGKVACPPKKTPCVQPKKEVVSCEPVIHPAPSTLRETLERTYMQNAELDAARAGLRATVEELSVAEGDWRPSLSVVGKQRNDVHQGSGGSGNWQEYYTDYNAVLSQNVYKGGATVAAIGEAESTVFSGKAGLFSLEQKTLYDAISAHTAIVMNEALVRNQQDMLAFSKTRLEYAQARYEVGEGGRTDVAVAQAEYDQALADLAVALGNLNASKANYLYQVGSPAGPLKPANIILEIPKTVEEALEVARAHNPSITEAKYKLEAAEYNVDKQIAGLLPKVDVESGVGNNWRGGTRYPPPWNDTAQTNGYVQGVVNIPLYLQGIPNARVRQAYQVVAQQKVGLINVQRKVIEGTNVAWANFVAARDSIKGFIAQVKALELSVEGIVEEYKVGLKSMVDVFVQRDKLTEGQNKLAEAQRRLVLATYGLLQSMGRLTACDMRLKVRYYDPDLYYREYKEAWFQFWQSEDMRYVKEVSPK